MSYDADYWRSRYWDLRKAVNDWLGGHEVTEHTEGHDEMESDTDCVRCAADGLEALIAIRVAT